AAVPFPREPPGAARPLEGQRFRGQTRARSRKRAPPTPTQSGSSAQSSPPQKMHSREGRDKGRLLSSPRPSDDCRTPQSCSRPLERGSATGVRLPIGVWGLREGSTKRKPQLTFGPVFGEQVTSLSGNALAGLPIASDCSGTSRHTIAPAATLLPAPTRTF